MSATVLERPQRLDFEVPARILADRPYGADVWSGHVQPDGTGTQKPAYLHPVVLLGTVGGYAWMLFVFWIIFAATAI